MEQQRGLIFIVFLFVSFLVYQAYVTDQYVPPQGSDSVNSLPSSGDGYLPADMSAGSETDSTNGNNVSTTSADTEMETVSGGDDDMPVPVTQNTETVNTATTTDKNAASAKGEYIEVDTDALQLYINTQGGSIVRADLKLYPTAAGEENEYFRIMDRSGARIFEAQTGFYSDKKKYRGLTPTSKTIYKVEAKKFPLQAGQEEFDVDLVWFNSEGTKFVIRYTFSNFKEGADKKDTKDVHNIKVTHIVTSNSDSATWRGYSFARLERNNPQAGDGSAMLPTYLGPVYYHPEDKYDKVDFDDIDDSYKKIGNSVRFDAIDREYSGGWIGVIEHYFVGAFVPPKHDVYRYFTNKPKKGRTNSYWIGITSLEQVVDVNTPYENTLQLYIGPKIQSNLEGLADGLELTVDYGWLTFISKPLFWLLDVINDFLGNWGWSIILLTILIKLMFYKLSEASYKSMANMRRVGPRMKQIKERHTGDRQRMNQAMMELYRKEKINPLGGCFPILIQIPVFIALYYVLLESVELRQADWAFWIHDLSTKDPYFILPIVMGASMIFQQKLNPAPLEPMQAKIMMFLPIVFTFLFMWFPSGLVLYWVVNNLLSILQQWYITRHVMKDVKNPSAKS